MPSGSKSNVCASFPSIHNASGNGSHENAMSTFSWGSAHFASGPVSSDALPRPSQFDYPATTNTS